MGNYVVALKIASPPRQMDGSSPNLHTVVPRAVCVAVRYYEPHRLSHLEDASLHPGLYKRLRAVVAREF